jgi:hypothetical protein
VVRKRSSDARGRADREPHEIPDGIAPARGIALALGIGALAWLPSWSRSRSGFSI